MIFVIFGAIAGIFILLKLIAPKKVEGFFEYSRNPQAGHHSHCKFCNKITTYNITTFGDYACEECGMPDSV